MDIKQQEEKNVRIAEEVKILKSIYSKIGAKNKKLISGLIQRAAYMKITLEDYEKDLDEKGYVESFTQSEKTEPYERERPVARLYNTMNKNYQSIIKQLSDLLPEEKKEDKGDGFDDFVGGRDDA